MKIKHLILSVLVFGMYNLASAQNNGFNEYAYKQVIKSIEKDYKAQGIDKIDIEVQKGDYTYLFEEGERKVDANDQFLKLSNETEIIYIPYGKIRMIEADNSCLKMPCPVTIYLDS